jgi:hypothetical protein
MKLDLNPILKDIGEYVQFKAKENCPDYTGKLKDSIDYRVEGNTVIISAKGDGAVACEYGKPPWGLTNKDISDLTEWSDYREAPAPRIIGWIKKHGILVGDKKNPTLQAMGVTIIDHILGLRFIRILKL